jgi:hypothetical protein
MPRGKTSAPPPDPSSFAAQYPHVASWVQDGYVEIGRTDWTRSFVRALDEGGMIWEGATRYPSLDAALRALDAGIAKWLEENG